MELGDLILANLTTLDIRGNEFTGVFPESIANAAHLLVTFCFSNNLFTGNVPENTEDCLTSHDTQCC
jgi:hypothetical protein